MLNKRHDFDGLLLPELDWKKFFVFWLCCVFLLPTTLSSFGVVASLVVEHRLSNLWRMAWTRWPWGMQHLPGPGVGPASPALADGFLTLITRTSPGLDFLLAFFPTIHSSPYKASTLYFPCILLLFTFLQQLYTGILYCMWVWSQTTTINWTLQYSESHEFFGFPVHIKVVFTLHFSLLNVQ